MIPKNKEEDGAGALAQLFEECFHTAPSGMVRMPGAGSDRVYWRLVSPHHTAVGVVADSIPDALAFIGLAGMLRRNGVAVPEIYRALPDGSAYLQEDLGATDLLSLIGKPEAPELVEMCMRSLARMQTLPTGLWSDMVAYPPMDSRQVMWDLNYFKYEFLKPAGPDFREGALEDDFERLAARILSIPRRRWGFMMRDCQSRNVMVKEGKPYWIDFQGGRMGPVLYDAVSFLYQAKASFSGEFRRRMLEIYASEVAALSGVEAADLLSDLPALRLFRTLQVLGAYGFRGLVQKRAHFLESIPKALRNLESLIEDGDLDDYPELRGCCLALLADKRFVSCGEKGKLTVRVFSFSYKKGYPEDLTGNGGGFMFDCRAMHNPGRYEEYKNLTGLDPEVAAFLEARGEVQPFLEAAWSMTAPAVDRYLRRGFTSLQIGFGCTGGQHRSVYCANHLARRLAREFPEARVVVAHRERGITKDLQS